MARTNGKRSWPRRPGRMPAWLLAAALVGAGLPMTLRAARAAESPAQPAAAAAQPAAAQPAAAQPGAAGAGGGTVAAQGPKMSALDLALRGGVFMIPLAICSLAGLAVIIERSVALRRSRIIPPAFLPGLKAAFRHADDDREKGLDYCRAQDSPVSRVVAAGVAKLHRGEDAVEQAIEDSGANEVAKLRKNLRFLYGISAVSPMLGLLGTVSGMITAFQVTSVIVGPEKSLALAKGIYEALITTYAGLCIAIPTLIAYYFFQGKIERLVSEMNDISIAFMHEYVTDDRAARATEAAREPSVDATRPAAARPVPAAGDGAAVPKAPAAPASASAVAPATVAQAFD